MAQKSPRYYWGDLRLWKTGRNHEVTRKRGETQIYRGIDALDALVLPASPNYETDIKVTTFFDPYADSAGDYTRMTFRSAIDSMVDALVLRSNKRHTLCYIDDVGSSSPSTTVSSIGALTVTTVANPHGFVATDRVLIRRAGVDLYTIGVVASTPGANTFVLSSTPTHSVQAGDTIHRIAAFWNNMVFQDKGGIGLDKEQNWFNDAAEYTFKGTCPESARYSRQTISLDT